jgi:hypothetical protein
VSCIWDEYSLRGISKWFATGCYNTIVPFMFACERQEHGMERHLVNNMFLFLNNYSAEYDSKMDNTSASYLWGPAPNLGSETHCSE